MSQNDIKVEREIRQKVKRLMGWKRLLTVVFRIVIILGLLLLVFVVVLLLLIPKIPAWLLVFPLCVVGAGIVLARIEYGLHKRVVALKSSGKQVVVEEIERRDA